MNPLDILNDLLDSYNTSLSGVLTASVTETDSILTDYVVDLDDTVTRHAIAFEASLSAMNQALLSALSVVIFDFTASLNAGMQGLITAIQNVVIPALTLPQPQPGPQPAPTPGPGPQPAPTPTPSPNQSATGQQQTTATASGTTPVVVNVNVPKQTPTAMETRPERNEEKGKSKDGLLEKMLSATLGRLLAVLAPLTTFGTILVQSTSGLRVFLGAVNILAMTLAPILLPGFVLLAALILTVADIINAQLQPAMVEWYTLILGKGFAAVMSLIDGFEKIYNASKQFAGDVEELGKNLMALLPTKKNAEGKEGVFTLNIDALRGKKDGPAFRIMGGDKKPNVLSPATRNNDGSPINSIGGSGDWGDETKKPEPKSQFAKDFGLAFIKNMKEVAQEFRHQNQPKTELTSLVQASRQAQLAATGMSPFEQRQIKLQESATKSLDLAVNHLEKIAKNGVVGD